MRISRIYVAQPLRTGASIQLDQAATHYVRHVLRLKTDAAIRLFNADDPNDYVSILSYQGKNAVASIESCVSIDCESNLFSEIIQGLGRIDHMDWMVQKCTELGVTRISMFNAEHTQIRLRPAQLEKRLAHWRAVAVGACEQCGRHRPPEIIFDKQLDAVLNHAIQRDIKFLLDFEGEKLNSLLTPELDDRKISILVGPEGGLSHEEIENAKQLEFVPASLGPRVLRTETAAVSALAVIQSLCGDI